MRVSRDEMIRILNLLDLERELTSEDADMNLNRIGLNSLEFVKLVLILEDCFGIRNGEELLLDLSGNLTVNQIVERLKVLEN